MTTPPRFSVLTAVFDPTADHLRACLESVRVQTWPDWEHVVVDDGSTAPWVATKLAEAAAADPRVRVIRRPINGGIVAASRDALAAATGELIALVDHDDVLEPDALAEMHAAFPDGVDVAYSDHDLIAADGFYVHPAHKPDFSPERLRAHNYITHFVVARRTLVETVGGFREGFDGAQDHDLLLRLTEATGAATHVPRILYHWRQAATSVSAGRSKPWAFDAGVRAVADHCARVGIDATVERTRHEGCYRVIRRLGERPLVSVVIPTAGACERVWGVNRCFVVDALRSLVERSTYRELELVVVYDPSTPLAVLDALDHVADDRLTLLPADTPPNRSAMINLGVTRATGRLVLLLDDATELIEPASIEVLVGHLQMPDVAMAGAKLLFADGTLQHGGHVYAQRPDHTCFGWRGDSPGPELRPLAVERECSGVTAACALVRRTVFDEVDGFTTELPLNYSDVDFSLELRAAGHRIVWSPWAVWYHFESRGQLGHVLPHEVEWIEARWRHELAHDPYYNANLAPFRNDYLELPPPGGMLRREPW